MTILASDKTGTITENSLKLNAIRAYPPYREEDVIRFGAQASRLPRRIRLTCHSRRAQDRQIQLAGERLDFTPRTGDKRSEAFIARRREPANSERRSTAHALQGNKISTQMLQNLCIRNRVLAVAVGPDSDPSIGWSARAQDTPRPDSKT